MMTLTPTKAHMGTPSSYHVRDPFVSPSSSSHHIPHQHQHSTPPPSSTHYHHQHPAMANQPSASFSRRSSRPPAPPLSASPQTRRLANTASSAANSSSNAGFVFDDQTMGSPGRRLGGGGRRDGYDIDGDESMESGSPSKYQASSVGGIMGGGAAPGRASHRAPVVLGTSSPRGQNLSESSGGTLDDVDNEDDVQAGEAGDDSDEVCDGFGGRRRRTGQDRRSRLGSRDSTSPSSSFSLSPPKAMLFPAANSTSASGSASTGFQPMAIGALRFPPPSVPALTRASAPADGWLDSPLKPKAGATGLSYSRSLGRAARGGGARRLPFSNGAARASAQTPMRSSKSLAYGDGLFSAGMLDGAGGPGIDSDSDSDDETRAGGVSLRPLQFRSSFSPNPFKSDSTIGQTASGGGIAFDLSQSPPASISTFSLGPPQSPSASSFASTNTSTSISTSASLGGSSSAGGLYAFPRSRPSIDFLSPHPAANGPPPTPFPARTLRHAGPPPPHFAISSTSSSSMLSSPGGSSHFLASKKAVSLDNLHLREAGLSNTINKAPSRARRSSLLGGGFDGPTKGHKREKSMESNAINPFSVGPTSSAHLSRSQGLKSGLSSHHLSNMEKSSSLSHLSVHAQHHPSSLGGVSAASASSSLLNRSAPASLSPNPLDHHASGEPFTFDPSINDAKPLQAAFAGKSSLAKKFKPRDSGVVLEGDTPKPSEKTVGTPGAVATVASGTGRKSDGLVLLNIPGMSLGGAAGASASSTSSNFASLPASPPELVTPSGEPSGASGWPCSTFGSASLLTGSQGSSNGTGAFDFLGADVAEALASSAASHAANSPVKVMPDTPVKRSAGTVPGGPASLLKAKTATPHPLSHPITRPDSPEMASGSSSPLSSATHHQPKVLRSQQQLHRLPPSTLSASGPSSFPSSHAPSNSLSLSHRPSNTRPPHLQIASTSRSLIPTLQGRPLAARQQSPTLPSFHLSACSVSGGSKARARSPELSASSSPPPEEYGGFGHSPTSALRGKTEALGQRRMIRRTSSSFGLGAGLDGGEESGTDDGGEQGTPTRRHGEGVSRAREMQSPAIRVSPSPTPLASQQLGSSLRKAPPSRSLSSQASTSSASSISSFGGRQHPSASTSSVYSAGGSLNGRPSLPAIPSHHYPHHSHHSHHHHSHASHSSAGVARRLHHRASEPRQRASPDEVDTFSACFVVLESIGKGAFSEVYKVRERTPLDSSTEGTVWAVKRTKGVFEGVKDRLRHLEEVDILRALSTPQPHPHIIRFEDAWEQNRQLFIRTEVCELGNLQSFLDEYGRNVERMDEGRVWKIVREISDGLHHIHSHQILHLDLKPANIFITAEGSLKIGDFGLSTRFPRVDPATILRGAGLGGTFPGAASGVVEKGWEREGDRDYMALETLRGVFGKEADIFSFGLLTLEIATNIIVPTNDQPWHALRSDDFADVDFSVLSPALTELIVLCMRADPRERPSIDDVVAHPVVTRARRGQVALLAETDAFLVECLAGGFEAREVLDEGDEDVEMS